jgi:hypothetical protein
VAYADGRRSSQLVDAMSIRPKPSNTLSGVGAAMRLDWPYTCRYSLGGGVTHQSHQRSSAHEPVAIARAALPGYRIAEDCLRPTAEAQPRR